MYLLTGAMRFSPAGLHQRMSAELNYLCTIEESVRQLSDMERVRGISLAQQESVSLAQILKVIDEVLIFAFISLCVLLSVMATHWNSCCWTENFFFECE